MLSKLTIRNYALIDSLSLDFSDGLTIITGETGAGKSIMLGALSMLLGARAETRVIADSNAKSVVEARFSNVAPSLRSVFEQHQLDWIPEETIIRREISASGRSRAFVNDSPVNLQTLSDITSLLVDIHSQHSTLSLLQGRSQLEVIDSFADNSSY
ncbi:MAG: AAA family ATPase, partial [Muribaculaceae bacterium]|nr:AAA family ATPase [Muribaculaceae bacterium]